MSYCSLFTKNDNIYDVQSLNRVILIGTLPNFVKMFSTKMSFSSSEMLYIETFFQELLPFVCEICQFCFVGSLTQVISNGT